MKRTPQIFKVSKVFAVNDLIHNHQGRFFTAKFIKQDGTLRKLNGRFGVRKGTTGKGMRYNPYERGYLNPYDVNKDDYRMINVDTLLELSFNGKKYIINGEKLSLQEEIIRL